MSFQLEDIGGEVTGTEEVRSATKPGWYCYVTNTIHPIHWTLIQHGHHMSCWTTYVCGNY